VTRGARLLLAGGLGLLAACLALEIAVPAHHGEHWTTLWFHSIPGFNAALGFLGCVLLAKVAKALGGAWLQRPEDYYGEGDDASDPEPAVAEGERHG
jgi:hypothetical protein